jgi:hypothetical protein
MHRLRGKGSKKDLRNSNKNTSRINTDVFTLLNNIDGLRSISLL